MSYPTEKETRVHAFVLPIRLQFKEGTHRYGRSAFFKRMRACMRKEGLITVSSRNWAICLPTHGHNIEQARITLALWLVDQPELNQFSTYFPVRATQVLHQKERFDELDNKERWSAQPRDIQAEQASPLMATLCGFALSQAVAQCGGAK